MKIFAALVLTLFLYMFIQWIIFQFHKYGVIDISSISKHLPEEEWGRYKKNVMSFYGDRNFGDKIDEKIFIADNYKLCFTSDSYLLSKRNGIINVKVFRGRDLVFENAISSIDDHVGFVNEAGGKMAFDVFDGKLYLFYETELQQNGRYLLGFHLMIADLKTHKIDFHKKILEGILPFGMAIAYHEETKTVLLAYQHNTSEISSDKQLQYAIYNPSTQLFVQEPKALFLYDGSEKSHPCFMRDKGQLYFLNTTGEHWGVLSYDGAPSMGISKINSQGEPVDYFIMYDNAEIIEPILKNNILTYSLRLKDEYDDEKIKSIDLEVVKK